MSTFFNWLARAMGDGENPSSARLIAVLCVPTVVLVPLAVWALLSLRAGELREFPGSITGFMAAANTLVLAAFHLNKREESKA